MATSNDAIKVFCVVRINGDSGDTYAAIGSGAGALSDAIGLAMPDAKDVIEYGWVATEDVGAARLMTPNQWYRVANGWYQIEA